MKDAADHSGNAARARGPGAWAWLLLALAPAAAAVEPLYLVFPHDYLSLGVEERHQYVLGVIDARLTANVNSARLPALVACVTGVGVDAIRRHAEAVVIPRAGAAATPMPWVIDQAMRESCPL